MKKLLVLALTCALSFSLVACGSTATNEKTAVEETTVAEEAFTEEVKTEEVAVEAEAKSEGITINYPEHMQALGFEEPVVLESTPERVVCLSTYPVLALFDLGITPIALPKTSVISYPEDYAGEILPSIMSDNFDIETVVALEPDLVFMPASTKEMYDETFSNLNIPVYYMAMTVEGMSAYDVIKEQTLELVNAFNPESDLMSRFDEIENELATFQSVTEGKTVFAMTVSGNSVYICSTGGTLGSMLEMCGLTNVYEEDTVAGHGMIELDMETAIDYTPDVVVLTGSSTAEDNQAMFEAIVESNPEYWNSIEAISEGNIIYLPSSYVSTAGLNILTNLEGLMSDLGAAFN